MNTIPKRKKNLPAEPKRFYVMATTRVHADLLKEAAARGTDLYTLGGAVLSAWIEAGSPDFFERDQDHPEKSPSPPPSSSPLAHDQGAGQ